MAASLCAVDRPRLRRAQRRRGLLGADAPRHIAVAAHDARPSYPVSRARRPVPHRLDERRDRRPFESATAYARSRGIPVDRRPRRDPRDISFEDGSSIDRSCGRGRAPSETTVWVASLSMSAARDPRTAARSLPRWGTRSRSPRRVTFGSSSRATLLHPRSLPRAASSYELAMGSPYRPTGTGSSCSRREAR